MANYSTTSMLQNLIWAGRKAKSPCVAERRDLHPRMEETETGKPSEIRLSIV